MNPYPRRRLLYNRQQDVQGVGNANQAVGNQGVGKAPTSSSSSTSGTTSQNTPTEVHTFTLPSPTTTSATSPTAPSSSSTGSTATSTSSAHSITSTSLATTTSSPTPTPTPTLTSSSADNVYATTDGTSIVYLTSTVPSPSTTTAPHSSFLQNPPLEGGVFALVALVALVIVFAAITWTLRRRRRTRLERDLAAAITFDPGATEHYEQQEVSIEKHSLTRSSSGHGGYGHGIQMQPAYAPHHEYHGPVDYGRYPVVAYSAPLKNPAPYRALSPTAHGGANLTRKFSDRKPVPPLLLNPTYDPSNAHVSIPPQIYQQ